MSSCRSVTDVLRDDRTKLPIGTKVRTIHALAVEMEGYGFHNALSAYTDIQAIVVRGVSDVVDGKSSVSDRAWQPVAASRAAAFALTVAAGLVESSANKRSIK